MSANFETGLFNSGIPAWHKLGTVINRNVTTSEAMKLSGLDWTVKTEPLQTLQNERVTHQAIRRQSDQTILGEVGPNYQPLQNLEAFKFFDKFLDTREAMIESCGSLDSGKKVWILAKLNAAPIEVVKNDIINKYLLLSNSHDGTLAVRTGFTPIRVVCSNTLSAAINSNQSQLIRLKHTKNIVSSLDAVGSIINAYNAQFEATENEYKYLASKDINAADLKKYVKLVFYPIPKLTDRQESRLKEIENDISKLFQVGRGTDIAKPTYWRAYNAVNEYLLDYTRAKDDESRLHSMWFGGLFTKNQEALKVALDLAAA